MSRPRSHSLVASVLKAVLREQKCNLKRLFLSYSYLIILLHFLFSIKSYECNLVSCVWNILPMSYIVLVQGAHSFRKFIFKT